MNNTFELTGRKIVQATSEEANAANAARARNEARLLAKIHHWRTFDREELTPTGRRREYLADRTGQLYEVIAFDPDEAIVMPGRGPDDVDAWFEAAGEGLPVYLRRPPRGTAQTVGEIEEARAEVRRRRREAEAAKTATVTAKPLEPYTLAALERIKLPTLAEAAARIEKAHGVIEADGDRLVFLFHGPSQQGVALSVRVLKAEQELVLAALTEANGEPLSELLPDVQARA